MRSETLKTANVYRHLLKAVKKHIVNGKEGSKTHFLEFVTSEFRKNRNLSDAVSIQNKMKLARDYTILLNSVHHHKVLLSLLILIGQMRFTQTHWVKNMIRCQHLKLINVCILQNRVKLSIQSCKDHPVVDRSLKLFGNQLSSWKI